MKKLAALFILIVSLTTGLISCNGKDTSKNKSPGPVVKEFYKLIQDNAYEKAAAMYAHKGQRLTHEAAIKMENIIRRAADDYEKKGGIKEIIIIDETIFGDYKTAKVRYVIVFNNGDEDDKKQALKKINNHWYLSIIAT
ncbi:MAG: DUF4878 domain-containing protein [Bacteroidales bacterium]|jgi:hypothetical protein|nr:DUF4878 domain-containing protein [Bacteroidales bacterium]